MTQRLRFPLLVVAIAAAAMAIELAAFWPGIIVWDAIRQYGQALSGRYDDWHPPAMNWLWRQLRVFGAGPAPMLVLQAAGYWAGFALLAVAARRRLGHAAGWGVAACALLPVSLWLVGTILKDSVMDAALLLAAGLVAWGNRGARAAAALLLVCAATLRFNAVAACLPLLVAALAPSSPARGGGRSGDMRHAGGMPQPRSRLAKQAVAAGWWRGKAVRSRVAPHPSTTAFGGGPPPLAGEDGGRGRLLLLGLVALVPLLLAMPLANRALRAGKSGVELSLVLYDLGGVTHFSGADVLPRVAPDQAATVARCWNPISWDRYAWWVDDPCPVGFEALRPALGAHAYRWWLTGIAHHPIAYAAHRLAHVDRNLRLWVHDGDLPRLSLRSDPNGWGYQVPPSRLRDALAGYVGRAEHTPLGWPACWLALAIGLLVAAPARGPAGDLARPLLWSATLYGLSYVPLSVASEVRYHAWTILAAALGAVLLCARRQTFAGTARWRRVAGAALPLAVLGVSVAARAF